MPQLRHTFPRTLRIKSAQGIDTLYKLGKKRSHHPLVAHGLRRDDNLPARIAISIGRSCGNAVARNLIKRRIREAFRLIQHEIPPGSDYLLVIRPHKTLEMLQYQDRLRQLLRGDTVRLDPAAVTTAHKPKRGKGKGKERGK